MDHTKPLLPTWLIGAVVVLMGAAGVFAAAGMFSRPATQTPDAQQEEAPTPTPTPIRTPSAIASQSAFLSLEQAAASLSAHIQALPAQDPSLSPPALDLELGFDE